MLKEFVKKNYRRFHFSLSVNLLFLLFFATVFYCQFETNDDYAMKMIASGAFGSPDSHLIYINSFIGYILKTFYTLTPHIPWYEVFQFLLILISLSAVMYVLINRESNNLYLILLLMTVFLSAHSLYTTLQFTRTASILAIAGYLLLDDSIRKRRKIGIASSIVLIIFSSMIRQNQFLVMSLLCTTVFLPMLYDFVKDWKNETKKGDVLRLILSGAICLLLFVCANLFHKADYQGEKDVEPEDRVEIFFSPREEMDIYWCAEMDPAGRVLDYEAKYYRVMDYGWNFSTLELASNIKENGYTLWGKISKDELRALGVDLSNFRMGVFRADFRPDGSVNWYSAVPTEDKSPDFHKPDLLFSASMR